MKMIFKALSTVGLFEERARGVFYTGNQFVIRWAWGPRRVSSKWIGQVSAYPNSVAAAPGVWLDWFVSGARRWLFGPTYVVIGSDPEGGHGKKYAAELLARASVAEAERVKADMLKRLPDLQKERAEARAAKDFARADAIRDMIEAAGIQVNDAAISKEATQ